MKSFFSEKNLVVILFILVLITFSLAQEDSRKLKLIQPFSSIKSLESDGEQKISNNSIKFEGEKKNLKNISR